MYSNLVLTEDIFETKLIRTVDMLKHLGQQIDFLVCLWGVSMPQY